MPSIPDKFVGQEWFREKLRTLTYSAIGAVACLVPTEYAMTRPQTVQMHTAPSPTIQDIGDGWENILRALSLGGGGAATALIVRYLRSNQGKSKPECLHRGFMDLLQKINTALTDSKYELELEINNRSYLIEMKEALNAVFDYCKELYTTGKDAKTGKLLPISSDNKKRLSEIAETLVKLELENWARPNNSCSTQIDHLLRAFHQEFQGVDWAAAARHNRLIDRTKKNAAVKLIETLSRLSSQLYTKGQGATTEDSISIANQEQLPIPAILSQYSARVRRTDESKIHFKTFGPLPMKKTEQLHPALSGSDFARGFSKGIFDGWYEIDCIQYNRFLEQLKEEASQVST